jgi:hypothetical protein
MAVAVLGGGLAMDFAPDQQANLPPDIALAYASILNKAPPKPTFDQQWTACDPDMQISRIRLSDKTSRLHPRHVVPKPAQAYEIEVPVKVSGARLSRPIRLISLEISRPGPIRGGLMICGSRCLPHVPPRVLPKWECRAGLFAAKAMPTSLSGTDGVRIPRGRRGRCG